MKNKSKTTIFLIGLLIVLVLVFYLVSHKQYPTEEDSKVYCKLEQRKAEICTALYSPVCGWFNSSIKCLKYPCAQTFSNSCSACSNEKVEYLTKGECPK